MKILYYGMISLTSATFAKNKISFLLLLVNVIMSGACKTTAKTATRNSATTTNTKIQPDSLIKKQQEGIDFIATGNEPVAWRLELDLETGFRFKPFNSLELIAGPVPATRLESPAGDSYISSTDSGQMKVMVYDEFCTTAEKASRKVEVTFSNKRFSGCGKYLVDEQLSNTWVLQYLDNREPDQQDYKKLPRLEFDLAKNTMTGFDGCDQISSSIFVNGNHIRFGSFQAAKPACPANVTSKLFSNMLSNHIVDYKIENSKLYIYLINDSKLTFTQQNK